MKQKLDMMIHNSMMSDIKFISERMMFQITRFVESYPEYRCTCAKVIKTRRKVNNITTIRLYFEETTP